MTKSNFEVLDVHYHMHKQEVADEILARIFAGCERQDNGCLLWVGSTNSNGYGRISWRDSRWFVHRVVAYKGNLAKYFYDSSNETLHSCDTPNCCEPSHLSLGTRLENMQDAKAKGRLRALDLFRERRSLTDVQVLEIKLLLNKGLTYAEVARVSGVDFRKVRQIALGLAYTDITFANTTWLGTKVEVAS